MQVNVNSGPIWVFKEMKDEDANKLAKMIASKPDLLSLTIRGPGHRFNHGLGISGLSGTHAILKAIKKHPSMANLDLGGNIALGDEIAPAISKMLLKNRSLISLDLSDCSITQVSLPFLVDGVKKNKTLVN